MTTYRITPFISAYGSWAWWAFRSNAFGGDTPGFKVAKANHYNMVSGERLCCWSTAADSDTWHDFDNVAIGGTDLEFSNNSAFPAGQIYIAALPMYPFSRHQRRMQAYLTSPKVSDTASSTNGIIGNATARSVPDGSGRTAPALPFYGFKLTNNSGFNKNKAILAAHSHATEMPGPFVLEGALDWLLSGTANAETLLNWFEFYVYPCTNPQGVWSGWFRTSPEVPATSHDWCWDETGTDESVDAFKAAMNADTSGDIDVGFDYHSFMSSTDIHGTSHTGDTGGNYGFFATEMAALDGDFNLTTADLSKASAVYFKSLGASLAVTIEQGGELARNVPEYKTFGANTMKALYEMLVDGRFTYGP